MFCFSDHKKKEKRKIICHKLSFLPFFNKPSRNIANFPPQFMPYDVTLFLLAKRVEEKKNKNINSKKI